jgi:hypothetical protein
MNISNNNYTVEEKIAARFKILEEIYNTTGGSEKKPVSIDEIGKQLNLNETLVEIAFQYLKGENLIKAIASGIFAITHYGVVAYEEAKSNPTSKTEYFLPVNIINNILNTNSINNSQVQLCTKNSNQELIINKNDISKIKEWLDKLEGVLKENQTEKNEKIYEEIETIRALMGTKKPNVTFINSAMSVIKDLLINLSSNAIFQLILNSMPK